MKGILLVGGLGTRLFPITKVTNKHLLPIYDKPMVYYSLSILLMSGIRDICIISSPRDLPKFKDLFGDGSELGCSFTYIEQLHPNGIAYSFILAEEFIGDDTVCLMLGDNIINFPYENDDEFLYHNTTIDGGLIFAHKVKDPQRFGVVEFNTTGKVISIEEKPKKPKSEFAIPGLYYFDNNVCKYVHDLKPSKRGEYEITDVALEYTKRGKLQVNMFPEKTVWLDTGTIDSLYEASDFFRTNEHKLGNLLDISREMGFIR